MPMHPSWRDRTRAESGSVKTSGSVDLLTKFTKPLESISVTSSDFFETSEPSGSVSIPAISPSVRFSNCDWTSRRLPEHAA